MVGTEVVLTGNTIGNVGGSVASYNTTTILNIGGSPGQNDLSDIPYASGARFDSDRGCMPGTREGIINTIKEWINSPDGDNVSRMFLLYGVAGSGKSAIAHTVAKLFEAQGRLGSSYFFDRAVQAKRNPRNLFSTIAIDIADLDNQWKQSLCQTIGRSRALRTTVSPREQFERFILEPSKALTTVGPIVIVIDALDESGNEISRKPIVDILATRLGELPPNMRILVTARSESDIINRLKTNRYTRCKSMSEITSTDADISLFIENKLSGIRDLEREWPNKQWRDMLCRASDSLFQWASTACLVVKDGGGGRRPSERLQTFISLPRGLDELYSKVLSHKFDVTDETAMNRFRVVMGRILAAKEPLSIMSLSELRAEDDDPDVVELIVGRLGSLLSGVDQPDIPLRALHTSFFDFLSDGRLSKSFYVDPSEQNRCLAMSSLRVMKAGLRFNICKLKTSHVRNCDIPAIELASLIKEYIPAYLSYACRAWADHLVVTAYDDEAGERLWFFFRHQLLYWLEVLSLIRKVDIAPAMLLSVSNWIQNNDENLSSCATDAGRFVATFGRPISQSAPHIYISALPFAPQHSQVAQHFSSIFPKTLSVRSGKTTHWPSIINVLEGHTGVVNSVSFSPDGKRIASGSVDSTIRVWDAVSGDLIVGPLEGHTYSVNSVAFSPDGKWIASGSDDKTIRVWDAVSGDVIVGPLQGHTDSINSVAFSPDGKWITSGSDDKTIRVWDAVSGGVIVGPLEGHKYWVNSVAFSPDGKWIASGSNDETIRVWDALSGDVIVGPLKGHMDRVNSMAFSRDGKWIASGSDDKTIRVWDVVSGDVIVGPLKGHTNSVKSVAFSPDSKWIASGSWDKTIRVWDAASGDVIVGPLEGHKHSVNSVAFSPDGKWIASGSSDRTIRVWDAVSGDIIVGPRKGHKHSVKSVAFSPDGKQIASGSYDETIQVWDAVSGDVIVGPHKEHMNWINSVAFSPDGKRIASGSDDDKVRVWDVVSRDVIVGPLEGHTDSVTSVAFSPDGKRIASGSWDKTIRVWDAVSGDVIVGPLEGHKHSVKSVVFSPDSKRIASGSDDKTIRVWDAVSGDVIVGPLEGHAHWVNSVAFSRNGKWIASGSWDKTIRVWDAASGDVIVGPFKGHEYSVNSVAFSPDGKRIASGSDDKTIRVWDVVSGDVVVGPLKGHMNQVNSVAFSPDGRWITSGSDDNSIRVWDVASGDVVGLLKGQMDWDDSVAFSLDDKQITSGSDDKTGRMNENVVAGVWGEYMNPRTSVTSLGDPSPNTGSDHNNLTVPPICPDTFGSVFSDQSVLEDDGWMINSPSTLLFWVPHRNRSGLYRHRNILVIAPVPTKLDCSNFVHGDLWTQCKV